MQIKRASRLAYELAGVLSAICLIANAVAEPTVFRCVVNDVVTFSDRPCGADAQTYEADTARFSTITPTPSSKGHGTHSKKSKRKSHGESIAAAQAKHRETCSRIDRSLREIRSKMRAGYDVKQGERLNERQRKLSQQQREERC
jgi:hypothetical protein